MKKLPYIVIALFAFIAGIFVFYVRPLFIPVRLSEVERKLGLYESREIKVKGYLIVNRRENSTLIYNFLDYKDDCPEHFEYCLAEATVELPGDVEKKEESWIKESAEKNDQYQLENLPNFLEGGYGAEVEITGLVVSENEYFEKQRFLIRELSFVIKVKEIKQISPIKFVTIRKAAISK